MPIRDTRMMARALEQRWPITDTARKAIVSRLLRIVADPNSSPREVTAASKALMEAEKQNQADEQHVDDMDDARRNRLAAIATRLGLDASALGTPTLGSSGFAEPDGSTIERQDQRLCGTQSEGDEAAS